MESPSFGRSNHFSISSEHSPRLPAGPTPRSPRPGYSSSRRMPSQVGPMDPRPKGYPSTFCIDKRDRELETAQSSVTDTAWIISNSLDFSLLDLILEDSNAHSCRDASFCHPAKSKVHVPHSRITYIVRSTYCILPSITTEFFRFRFSFVLHEHTPHGIYRKPFLAIRIRVAVGWGTIGRKMHTSDVASLLSMRISNLFGHAKCTRFSHGKIVHDE